MGQPSNSHRKFQRFTPAEIEEVVRRYQSGESGETLATAFNTTASSIHKVLRLQGVPRRNLRAAKVTYAIATRDVIAAGLCPKCKNPTTVGVLCDNCKGARGKCRGQRRAGPCRNGGPAHEAGVSCTFCNAWQRRRHLKDKLDCLDAYGGRQCSCPGCSECDPIFLTLDHVNNDGAKHRRQMRQKSTQYAHLRRMGYPPGYRVLCFNCNFAAQFGPCPHTIMRYQG